MTACVYRHYDEWGRLLYIGFSMGVAQRSRQHFRGSQWGDVIGRIEVARFATRQEALDAERRAIIEADPPYNRTNAGRIPRATVRPRNAAVAAVTPESISDPASGLLPELQAALRKLANVTEFAKKHRLPARTIWRIRAGGTARKGTIAVISAALDMERRG